MARVTIKNWQDVITETDSNGLKLDLHLQAGVLDAHTYAYWMPDDDWYDMRPDLTQDHRNVEQIFYSWEQLASKRYWYGDKIYWLIFTHPEKHLPCIVQFTAIGWHRDDDLEILPNKEEQ